MNTSAVERLWRRGIALGAAGLVLAALWACGDDNLFSPGVVSGPEVALLEVPEEVSAGDRLFVRTQVRGDAALQQVEIEVTGAITGSETISVPAAVRDVTLTERFPVPDGASGSASVLVIGTDVRGNDTAPATATVTVVP